MGTPTSVLIYYANDTVHEEPYRRIVSWLRDRDEATYREVASRVEEDLKEFPFAIDRDLGAIWRGIMSSGDDLSAIGIAVFTNENAIRGKFFYGNAGDGELREATFNKPDVDREHFRIHPLSHPDTLLSAMKAINGLFDAACKNCTLVTKSHGNKRLALTSLFSGMLDHKTPEQFFRNLEDDKAILEPTFELWIKRPKSIDAESGLGFTHLGVMHLRELINGIGTDKQQFMSVLGTVGKMGMHFNLVVMESCDSKLGDEIVGQIPGNVDRLLTSSTTVPYTSIDYRRAFSFCRDGVLIDDAVIEVIREPFALQSRR